MGVDMNEAVAEIYEALGDPRAALARTNCDNVDPNYDPHAECESADAIAEILHAVPDAKKSLSHDKDCWQRHAACLRDRLYADLGWE